MTKCNSGTNVAKKCATKYQDHQPWPKIGKLAQNMNLPLGTLRKKIGQSQAIVYCYIIATIENQQGHFVQRGSGPNFQGDLITLCTCKHRMRTFMSVGDWKGNWVAGFTNVKAGERKNYLVYLMQVSCAYESHFDLWKAIPDKTKQAKAAHLHNLGDVYKPNRKIDPFDPQDYVHPCDDHVHAPGKHWHKDIDYRGCSQRRAALLVGDIDHSFLWSEPVISYSSRLYRGQKKSELGDLLNHLEAGA